MEFVLDKKSFARFVENLLSDESLDVEGVKEKDGKFVFGHLDSASDLRLDHDVTLIPPKKYFLPQYETILRYDLSKPFSAKAEKEQKGKVLLGIHPYDVAAIEQTDRVYLDDYADEGYRRRRDITIIVASDILDVSDRSFAAAMGTHRIYSGYDLLLTDLGGRVVVVVGSKKGKLLLEKHAANLAKAASPADLGAADALRDSVEEKYARVLKVKKEKWVELLEHSYGHPLWGELAGKCMQCGSCTMVCPTCYCYDILDETALDATKGKRVRTWDGCLLQDFTKVGSGEVFREGNTERFRHRFYRKGLYIPKRYHFTACVGCGRCATACLPDIASPLEVFNGLHERRSESAGGMAYALPETEKKKKRFDHMPACATIEKVEKLTGMEKLFEISMDDGDAFEYDPGQFVEVSLFGTGEAPISISSPPSGKSSFELVVRQVGNLTNKMHALKPGDKVGIRGPFGRGFDVSKLEGKDLLFVAGGIGIVPMRSLLAYVLDDRNRDRFGRVILFYGSKTPKDVLFMDEIRELEKKRDVTVKLTVDRCDEGQCWIGCTGVVTSLFPQVEITDAENTAAIVIGPPIMYKFVLKCLETLGIADERIYVSLERRMKCGGGKCGHCQINGVYVCREGPVFTYDEVKTLPEAFE
ncbi:MAG: hypothetical protein CVT48_02910 [Thermoplasmata archaeon HGW-Thermoplasmata-1]|nr:MAG: hypothetical protein CVT48_02910 [Thermoplasmata archaeon HGW-Thermoplasmata-1]